MNTELPNSAPERAIIRCAYQALRPLLMTEPAFRASVSEIVRKVVRFKRARYVLEHRALVRRSEPAPADAPEPVERPITPSFDPWMVDPDELARASRQLVLCPHCASVERTARGGQQDARCDGCAGSGRVYSWLAIESGTRVEVLATPRAVAEHWLAHALDEQDFLEEVWLHECEEDVVLPGQAVSQLSPPLQPRLGEDERIVQVCVQTFAVDAHEVHYQTAFGEGMVEVAGAPLTVFTAISQPLARRSSLARWSALSAAVLAVGAPLLYRAQHPWFEKYGAAASALALGLAASAVLGTALLGWLRASASRTAWSTWLPTAGACSLAALASALLISHKPSIADARDALQRRDLERATLTADALYVLGAPRDEQRILRDDIRLARMDLTTNLADKLAIASSEGWTAERRPAMESAILHALQARAATARKLHDGPSLRKLADMIHPLFPTQARTLTVEAAANENRRCMLKAEPRCIESSAEELARLGAHELAAQSRRVLTTLVRQRFERALEAVSHSRSAKIELQNLTAARILADKLAQLGAPIPSGTRSLIERGIRRTEAQIEADRNAQANAPARAPASAQLAQASADRAS